MPLVGKGLDPFHAMSDQNGALYPRLCQGRDRSSQSWIGCSHPPIHECKDTIPLFTGSFPGWNMYLACLGSVLLGSAFASHILLAILFLLPKLGRRLFMRFSRVVVEFSISVFKGWVTTRTTGLLMALIRSFRIHIFPGVR